MATTSKAASEKPAAAPAESEQPGLRGDEVDPTPNEHYTVAGVTAGKPTPETDLDHAKQVRRQLDEAARQR